MSIEEVVTIHFYLDQRYVTVNSLRDGIVLWELHHHCSTRQLLSTILMTIMLLKLSFFFVVDPGHCYSNLSEANRNTKQRTWVFEFRALYCDNQLAGMGDDILLWELQEQECQQRVCQHTDVVQTCQAGL